MLEASWNVVSTSLQLASIYGLVVLAVVVSFRIANFADLTMDGSFTLGAAVSAVLLLRNVSPGLALLAGTAAGAAAGTVTVLLHTRIGVNRLLAGIITMTVLYSVNLRVMERSNISLLDRASIFNLLPSATMQLVASVLGVLFIAAMLWLLLQTDLGFLMRATGENPKVVSRKGFTEETFLLLALAISNGMAAFAGGVACQYQGFTDIGMGTGLVIGSLTGLLLGEAILPPKSLPRLVGAALIGALAYQLVVGIGLRLGINPWDLKLATGFLLIGALILKHSTRSRRVSENIGSDPL